MIIQGVSFKVNPCRDANRIILMSKWDIVESYSLQ